MESPSGLDVLSVEAGDSIVWVNNDPSTMKATLRVE
jgi:hypothetical protein